MLRVGSVFLIVMLAGPLALAQQPPVSIRGRVIAAENDAALPRARVAVSVDGRLVQSVFADDRGAFALTAPEGATVTLAITKAGFAIAQRIVRAGEWSGQDLQFRLSRAASISGHVTDSAGEPVVEARVMAQRLSPNPADASASPAGFEVDTNDLGEFRFGGLPAGRYRFTAVLQAGPDQSSSTVDVRAGDELGPLDFVDTWNKRPAASLSGNARLEREGGVIRGRVLGPARRPIAGARVRTLRNGDTSHESAGGSDQEGRFVIGRLSAGSYALEASKTGYVTVQYGQRRAAEPGLQVALNDDEVIDNIDIVLSRGSAVTGTITDERGEPLLGVAVRALQIRHGNGRTAAVNAPGARERRTDDRGRYRLFGLLPGSYLIAASVDATISGADARGYAPIFHPGSTQVTEAVPVQADIGRDIAAIDLVFHQVPAARVTGIALDGSGSPLAGAILLVVSQRSGAIAIEPRQAVAASGDGSFTVPNVPPGDYVIQALKPRSREGNPEFGAQFVTATDGDPKPVSIRTSLGSRLEGRMVIDGPGKPLTMRASVMPMPADFDFAPIIGPGTFSMSQGADGTFSMAGLFGPTRFRLGGSEEWYLKSFLIGPVDVTDTPFDFGLAAQTIKGAEVVLSNAGAVIAGHVTDARSTPITSYSVVVFSTDRTKWFANSRFLKFARPSQDGGFEVVGLPPGEYWIAAVDSIQGNQSFGEWEKPEVLDALSTRAQRITLAERERYLTVLRLIRR
ncbi:MAG TPA: carboxypeptidase-like regulatory domain-containing protein [Vicinamibacterales bacterium]|nr:carboxypeptidase-like regulatory domain-containing protein [Vicinamibacterales bacterium]